MDIWYSGLVCGCLLLAAVGLVIWHVCVWRRAKGQQLEARELDYRWRQFRRRMQSSSMLGLVAVGVFVGRLIMMIPAGPTVLLIYWGVVVLLVVWVGLLAVADIVATKQHFARLQQDCLIEQAKLKAELRRIQELRSNGDGKGRQK